MSDEIRVGRPFEQMTVLDVVRDDDTENITDDRACDITRLSDF